MPRICAILPLLLSDERSAVRRKVAARFSLAILITAAAGLVLTSLGEQTHRDMDQRILRAAQDATGGPLV